MAGQYGNSLRKSKQKIKMRTRMSIPILLVVVFQILTFTSVLAFGGEFKNIREYAYNTLVEKTQNRSIYIQNELRAKPAMVQEYAAQINNAVGKVLREHDASIADLQSNKELIMGIMDSALSPLTYLLRRSMVNDAYLILETGDLYADEKNPNAKAVLYLRDATPGSGSGYGDLLLEMGFASFSASYGIPRFNGWSVYFDPDPEDMDNYGFYYRTIETARENSNLDVSELGYWSSFSRPSSTITPSLKYTLPLIAPDGTVYGVVGVGLLESTVLSNIPYMDFMRESACYVLGKGTSDDHYDVLTYSGSAYGTLLGRANKVVIGEALEDNIVNIETTTDAVLCGNVQRVQLYNPASPYSQERWALISVADRESVLQPVEFLQQMLVVSSVISLLVASVVAVLTCAGLIRPIASAIKMMKAKRRYNEVIRFKPSNIYEIDEMTDAITQLQINAQGFSSQVSKMISIADVGLGTFMFNREEDSVFVGQSLIKLLKLQLPPDEDAMMDRGAFLLSIRGREIRDAVVRGMEMGADGAREDHTEVCQIHRANGDTTWIRLAFIYSYDTVIGIVQDITENVMEKKRIEHERDHDSLTGLLNRHAYYQRVAELFHDREALKTTAFVMMDLDNLKYVNDTYGHDFGDDYIKTAAITLKRFESYGGIVSRISGDEFNICLPGFASKDEAMEIIEKVHGELLQGSCLLADGTHFRTRASAGVAWYPQDSDSYEVLMKYADFAMYTIKHSTKGEVAEFDMSAYQQDSVLLNGVEELNRIIDEDSVRYAFQSIVDARTGEIYGYEALMRVQSEVFRSPLDLIRTAKTAGRLYEIERMTWNNAMPQFQRQVDEGRIGENDRLFINTLSNSCIRIIDVEPLEEQFPQLLPRMVVEMLEGEDVNQEYLELKKEYVHKWRGQIALDDFGTGYNSEYALLNIEPDIIKIDRSIVSGCDKDASRRMIINSLIKLARVKNIQVLAEGVETEEEMRTLIACGIDLLQGYYLSRPLFEPQPTAPETVELIRRLANAASAAEDEDA